MSNLEWLLSALWQRVFFVDESALRPTGVKLADIISLGLLFISFLGFLSTAIGIWLTYYQVKQNKEINSRNEGINRTNFLKEFYTMMFSDGEIRTVWYMIEYNQFVYDGDYDPRFHGTEIEKQTDHLLIFVDLLCSLHERKVISDDEMDYFKYEIKQMYTNEALSRYLAHVKKSYDKVVSKIPYESYFDYCEKQFGKDPEFRPVVAPAKQMTPRDDSRFVLPVSKTKEMPVYVRLV